MSTSAASRAVAPSRSPKKIVFAAAFVLMTLFVVLAKNNRIMDPTSPIAQHFAPAKAFLIPHAIFAGLALVLGIFQFSNRLRAGYIRVHRTFGYVYAVAAVIGGPTGILVALKLGPPELFLAAFVQTFGWLFTLGIALYCVRNGNIAEHRRWMIRSYPFAAVFSVARLFVPLGIKVWGEPSGIIPVVWTTIALAGFLPSVYLEWSKIKVRKSTNQPFAIAGD
jgi:uncharacterized membrane protein YozB (DUF420 family)